MNGKMPEESKEIKLKVTVEHEPGVMSCFCIALLVIALILGNSSCNINLGRSIPVKTQHVEVQK